MSFRMRVLSIAVIAGCAGCAARRAAPDGAKVVDTAYVARRVSDEAVAARRAAGTSVDTIIVSPDHLDLRVGESVMFFRALTFRAVDTTGAEVIHFTPAFILPASEVFTMEGPMLRGLSPGEAIMFVEALPRTSDVRSRPSTAVRVVVHP
jgi:hypothetical protein